MSVAEENFKFVRARLKLAQALLEESDKLPGMTGYNLEDEADWWRHPRHEREALVNYLLLTCFDRLGQERGFTTFNDWLKSKKEPAISERNQVLHTLTNDAPQLDAAVALSNQYQRLYGVRNAFYRGIENLPPQQQHHLLESIDIAFDADHSTRDPNTIGVSTAIDDESLKRQVRLRYMFETRNGFTHRLQQHFSASRPMAVRKSTTACWTALFDKGQLKYGFVNQTNLPSKTGGVYVISTEWPFVLFEVLYAAIGEAFHRTDIDLLFRVEQRDFDFTKSSGFIYYIEAPHRELRDVAALAARFKAGEGQNLW